MDLFKFKDQYGKELRCPNIQGEEGKCGLVTVLSTSLGKTFLLSALF